MPLPVLSCGSLLTPRHPAENRRTGEDVQTPQRAYSVVREICHKHGGLVRDMGRRAIIVVLDGLGAGNAPDAAACGDEGANTRANTARAVGGLDAPTLRALGLGNVESIEGVPPAGSPRAPHGLLGRPPA